MTMKGPPGRNEFAAAAKDPDAAARLWTLSEDLAQVRL
jgi:hypothetical protein